MRITAVLSAQAIRFVNSREVPEDQRLPLIPLVKEVQDRYYFLQVPTKVEEFDFAKGVTFLSGEFERKAIDKFQVYNLGILCETKTDTDHCERFLEDVLGFGRERGVPFSPKASPDRAFYSSLEIHLDGEFGEQIARVSSISDLIMSKFKLYGMTTLSFPVYGFKLNSDAAVETTPIPSEFGFERRAGKPFSSSLYASWGPLRTQDHLEVLTMIEKMISHPPQ
jgi:hypothetical protein